MPTFPKQRRRWVCYRQGDGTVDAHLESGDESPLADRILAPRVGGHERPVGEAVLGVVVFRAPRQNHCP